MQTQEITTQKSYLEQVFNMLNSVLQHKCEMFSLRITTDEIGKQKTVQAHLPVE